MTDQEKNISIVCKRAEEKYHTMYEEAKEILINKTKSEAIKEFAEKAQSKLIKYPSEFRSAVYWDIHDTMKELMGE